MPLSSDASNGSLLADCNKAAGNGARSEVYSPDLLDLHENEIGHKHLTSLARKKEYQRPCKGTFSMDMCRMHLWHPALAARAQDSVRMGLDRSGFLAKLPIGLGPVLHPYPVLCTEVRKVTGEGGVSYYSAGMSVAAKRGSFVRDRLAFANSVVCAWDGLNGTVAEIDKLHPRVTRISCSIYEVPRGSQPHMSMRMLERFLTSKYAF